MRSARRIERIGARSGGQGGVAVTTTTRTRLGALLALALCLSAGRAYADEEGPAPTDTARTELRLGAQIGPSFAALTGERLGGWGMSFALDLRAYSAMGLGVVARPLLELGSPNLVGGDLGAAYKEVFRSSPRFAVAISAALGVTVAQRFTVPTGGFGLPGGATGSPSESYLTAGYFAEA